MAHPIFPAVPTEATESYRSLVDNLSDYAVFTLDQAGTITSWNPGVERIFGFTAAEFVGRPFAILFTAEDQAAQVPQARLEQAAEHGHAAERRWHAGKHGDRLFVDGVLTANLQDGAIRGYSQIMRDDTGRLVDADERLRLLQEAALRGAELDTILESIADGVFVGDRSGIRRCNAAGLKMLGYDHPEQLNREVEQLATEIETRNVVTGELLSLEEEPFVRALAGETVVEDVQARNIRTGQAIIVRCAASPVRKDGAVIGAVAVNTDVTGLRQAEAERVQLLASEQAARRKAEASERDYRFLAESIPEIVWTTDARGAGRYYNPRWYQYTGLTAEESLARPWHELVEPGTQRACAERWQHCMEHGEAFEIEVRLRRRDGVYRWHLCHAQPQRGDAGGIRQWTGICTNIENQKRSERALHQAAKLESIGVLAGGIAHDFNNLLTGIMGNTSLAREFLPENHAAGPILDDATRASQSAADLIRQLLAYAGRGRFQSVPVQLAKLIPEALETMQASLPANVRLSVEVDAQLPFVEADPPQVQQMITNLVLNAVQALPDGAEGRVAITTGARKVSETVLQDDLNRFDVRPGDFVSMTVRDSGTGMTGETLARIFDPFFSTKFTGRGLGLAAVLGVVRAHRGAILVASEPGQGSCFEVLLPAFRMAPAVRKEAPIRVIGPQRGKVLVVDDQQAVRRSAENAIGSLGYAVLGAESGQQAVDIFSARHQEIAAVLLDLTMPGLSGREVLQRLRQIDPQVRVVLSSGYDEAEALARLDGLQTSGFLQKPYTVQQLEAKLEQALGTAD